MSDIVDSKKSKSKLSLASRMDQISKNKKGGSSDINDRSTVRALINQALETPFEDVLATVRHEQSVCNCSWDYADECEELLNKKKKRYKIKIKKGTLSEWLDVVFKDIAKGDCGELSEYKIDNVVYFWTLFLRLLHLDKNNCFKNEYGLSVFDIYHYDMMCIVSQTDCAPVELSGEEDYRTFERIVEETSDATEGVNKYICERLDKLSDINKELTYKELADKAWDMYFKHSWKPYEDKGDFIDKVTADRLFIYASMILPVLQYNDYYMRKGLVINE